MEKKSYRDLFGISGKWLGYFWKYFENQGSSWKFWGLRLDYKETHGLFAKFLG
jgi:hypothetical protein